EAYSLAILVVDALGDQLDRWTVRIFATDLDEGAIEVARRGTYSRAALEHLPAEIVERHFTEVDGAYEVKKSIRGLMVFGQHDLGQRAPFPRIDLCICRNVLAYFTVELQTRALQLFAFSLRDGGYLVLGRSESAGPLAEFFHPVQPQLRVYQRRGERMLIPSARLATAAPFTRRAAKSRRVPAGPVAHSSRDDLARCLLALPIGVIVVDRRYDIQMMNGAASRLLGLHDVAIGQDLIHLARDLPAGQLRALIDAAFEEDASDSAVIPIAGARPAGAVLETMTAGRRAYLRIECYPHVSERSEGDDRTQRTADTVLLVVTDITGQETERRTRDEEAARRQADLAQAIAQLELQAEATRALIGNNQRLTMINIELSTAAEEAAIGTDEAQAATEELETLNEELHATNEELETLNEELQATNEELRTTNEELQARSIELQAQAAMLDEQRQVSEEERARLTAILSSMDDAVLVVDPGGRMILTNPSYDRIFGLGPPTGLEDAGGQPLPPGETPQARVARGDVFSMHFTTTAENGVRRRFEAHGAPVRRDGAVRWGVVVIRDISERSLHELREEFLSSVSHELQTPLTAIRAGLGLLELGAGPVLGPAERELLEAMRRNVERLRLLVDDLLAARQSSVGAPAADHASLDMRAAVTMATAAVQPLLAEKRQPLELELPVPLPVTGDARQLEQVMVNLLANAYRHTPPGTRITVSGWVTADEVRLAVRDTGPGLPAGELEAIFVRFYRAGLASDGAGLGLAIARNVVTLHEGRLWAESREGEGATFHLALPRAGGAEGDTP
ncbi:MAG TPA: CheR family methyltransferase, partial [Chloroflexota bacterium]|nr:CheR family methyltransferase [Chloroflexota bacterium]